MEAAQQQGATGTCLLELPNHLLLHILSLTDAHTLCAAARSCVALFRLASKRVVQGTTGTFMLCARCGTSTTQRTMFLVAPHCRPA